MDQAFLNKYEPMCNTLCRLGWFVAPYMLQYEFDELTTICKDIDNETSLDETKKKAFIARINDLLSETAFHPNYRSFFIFRSKEVPHISEFSHLYERSIYHYYKSDYTSAILTMLPAIEGALLSFYGWSLGTGTRKPGKDQLITKLRNEKINSRNADLDRLFSIFGRVMAEFLDKWIFSDTSVADLSVSWLNRHILAHGMSPVNINRQSDANRMILFFDLFISYLSISINKYYIFIPSDKKEINDRRDYIINLLLFPQTIKACIEAEERFLSENTNYSPPERSYDLQISLKKNAEKMAQIMSKTKDNKQQENA